MSSSLVRKSLSLIDDSTNISVKGDHSNKRKTKKQFYKDDDYFGSKKNKLTLDDAKRQLEKKECQLEKNLKIIKKFNSKIEIDDKIKKLLVKRATSKHPVHCEIEPKKKKKQEKTVFTEEDFKKFEEEYFVD